MEPAVVDYLFGIAKTLPLEGRVRLMDLLRQDLDKSVELESTKGMAFGRVSDFEHQKYLIESFFSKRKS